MKTMINITISILLLFGLCSLANCKACNNKAAETSLTEATQPAEATPIDTVKLSMNVDSVKIWFTPFRGGIQSVDIYVSDSDIKKVGHYNKNNVTVISSIDIKNELITYINKFFIDKTEKVIENKRERDYVIAQDYPYMEITGSRNGKEIFKYKTHIGDFNYDIDYNPEFLKFYELLDSMAMTQYYTEEETGRKKVDPLYRNLYEKYVEE